MLRTCTTHIKPVLQQIRLLPGFKHGWKNAQHRYSNLFCSNVAKEVARSVCCPFFRTFTWGE